MVVKKRSANNKNAEIVVSQHSVENGTLKTYVWGFIISIYLTLTAYYLVTHHTFSYKVLGTSIVLLAVIQFFVQIFFFLHLGKETKPRWKLGVLLFMIMVVFVLVGGSLWIMNNLNYRMIENPRALQQYMNSQNGF